MQKELAEIAFAIVCLRANEGPNERDAIQGLLAFVGRQFPRITELEWQLFVDMIVGKDATDRTI